MIPLCTSCQQPTNTCGCNKTKSDNITYTGPNLPCTGVDTNDNMTVVIQKLNDAFCTSVTSTTTLPPTTTSTTSYPNNDIPVYRVAAPCCGDVTERVVDLNTLNPVSNTFTGNDGRPYTLVSGNPIIGAPSVFISETDKNLYSNCEQWAVINGVCPTTTTSTTALLPCATYKYQVQVFNIYDCKPFVYKEINNATRLTEGRYYKDTVNFVIYRIVEFVSCFGTTDVTLVDADQKNACYQAQIATTTTTTTVPATTTTTTTVPATTTTTTTVFCAGAYQYNATFNNCDCSPYGTGAVVNLHRLTLNKWYYAPGINLKFMPTVFVGCAGSSVDQILDSTKRDNCSDIICPTTTTSTTAFSHVTSLSSTGRNTVALSCADVASGLVIYQSGLFPTYGTFVYTNALLTTPFNGGSLWYHSGSSLFLIDATGKIIGVTNCSTTPVSFVFTSVAQASSALACGQVTTMTLYAPDASISAGMLLYSNIGMTTPFVGTGTWYKFPTTNTAWQINSLGIVINGAACP